MTNKSDNSTNWLKKVAILLTIIVSILGITISIFYIYNSFTLKSPEFFGPLLNTLTLAAGFGGLIYTAAIILIIWLIYAILNTLDNSYKKFDYSKRRKFRIIMISLILISLFSTVFLINHKNNNKNITKVLENKPTTGYYDDSSYYFVYNDKIYYYLLESDESWFTSNETLPPAGSGIPYEDTKKDKLCVMNLDGTDHKILTENKELRHAHFNFVYNNEAYYYSNYYGKTKKINLETGEISDLNIGNDYLLSKHSNDIVHSLYQTNKSTEFKKIDLKGNNILFETTVNKNLLNLPYFLDYDNGNIYHFEYGYNQGIYINDNLLYPTSDYDRYNSEFEFMLVNDNYIYFKQDSRILKLDTNTGEIERAISYKVIKSDLKDVKRISSMSNNDNFFYADNKIYYFNLETGVFDLTLEDITSQPDYVYNVNNKLIFTKNTDDDGYAIIYDKITKNAEIFNNIQKTCFDENKLYLVIEENNTYSVKTYNL